MGIDPRMLGEAAQRQILAKLQGKPYKPPKYHNEKATRRMPNGEVRTFDSQREARRYDELYLLLKAGQIKDLRLQQTFTLQESYVTAEGEMVRGIVYKADFVYWMDFGGEWTRIVEDAKGVQTDGYKLKKKLMHEKLGITVQEV